MSIHDKEALRDSFAASITAVGNIIDEGYWFSIQGNCHMSRCLLTILSTYKLAVFYVLSEFVETRMNKKEGGFNVHTSATNIFMPFILYYKQHFSLFGMVHFRPCTKRIPKRKIAQQRKNILMMC